MFNIVYVNVCVKRIYPHKTNNNILFDNEKIPECQFSVPWSSLRWLEITYHIELEKRIPQIHIGLLHSWPQPRNWQRGAAKSETLRQKRWFQFSHCELYLYVATSGYGVYIPQCIRYSRACCSNQDFVDRGLQLTRKLLNQRYVPLVVTLPDHFLIHDLSPGL